MAEDAVNNAIFVAKFEYIHPVTKNLPIHSSEFDNIDYDDGIEKIYSAENIKKFVEEEMAVSIEDILARRTRLLFLDVKKALLAAPIVAKAMASVLQKDEEWIQIELDNFTQLAKNYLPTTSSNV
jgi:glycerol-3-phosphate dehydrogenase